MNYNQVDKITGDIADEVNSIYKIALIMLEYIDIKDINPYDMCTQQMIQDAITMKRGILLDLIRAIDDYKKCNKIMIRNDVIVHDRHKMDSFINELKLKVISDNFNLDTEIK